MAEKEVLDGIEADCAKVQCLLHGSLEIVDVEDLEQAKNLHVFASSGFDHPRFHQAAQGRELRRQIPVSQVQMARIFERFSCLSYSFVNDSCLDRCLIDN